jgi:hypothetical protein
VDFAAEYLKCRLTASWNLALESGVIGFFCFIDNGFILISPVSGAVFPV